MIIKHLSRNGYRIFRHQDTAISSTIHLDAMSVQMVGKLLVVVLAFLSAFPTILKAQNNEALDAC